MLKNTLNTLESAKTTAGKVAAGLAISTCISGCAEHLGEPLKGSVDGQYNKEAIIEMMQSGEVVTSFTPEIKDLVNEFYATTGYHHELDGLNIVVTDDIEELCLDVVSGCYRYDPSGHFVVISQTELPDFLSILMHEVAHQYELSFDHLKVAANETAKTMLLYSFAPKIGFPLTRLRRFNMLPMGYKPHFWQLVAESGDVVAALDEINKSDVKRDAVDSQTARQWALEGLSKLHDTGNFSALGDATPGQIETFLAYLAEQAGGNRTPHCTNYLNGLQRVIEEGVEPNPYFLQRFLSLYPRCSLQFDEAVDVIDVAEEIDVASWVLGPAADDFEKVIHGLHGQAFFESTQFQSHRVREILTVDENGQVFMAYSAGVGNYLSDEEIDKFSGRFKAAIRLSVRYLEAYQPSRQTFNEISILGHYSLMDEVSNLAFFQQVFDHHFNDGAIGFREGLAGMVPAYVTLLLDKMQTDFEEHKEELSNFVSSYRSCYNKKESCLDYASIREQRAIAYVHAASAYLAKIEGEEWKAEIHLESFESCAIPLNAVVSEALDSVFED